MKRASYSITSTAAAAAVIVASGCLASCSAFQPQLPPVQLRTITPAPASSQTCLHADTLSSSPSAPSKGFANQPEEKSSDPMDWKVYEVKEALLDLIPRMTGTEEEFRKVESYINALEDKFLPPQTLGFLNLAMAGDWQFLFTSNQLGRPSPLLRLTELVQTVGVQGLKGKLVNSATWALIEENAFGTFSSELSYDINQGARITLDEELDLKIELTKGSDVPSDPEGLVGLIHRAMPTEMFDASELALDTTYVDTDLRIVRFTGKRHEGVRNIFMRKGAFEINPDL